MKVSLSIAVVAALASSSVYGFTPIQPSSTSRTVSVAMSSTMAESGVPPATSEASDVADLEIPTKLPSDCGMDYIPLATMLATGNLAEADQVGDVLVMIGAFLVSLGTHFASRLFGCPLFAL